jgi:hypothetical protein
MGWMIPLALQLHSSDGDRFGDLLDAVARWVPALGFSLGLDTLTTGMIAGRLIHHHKMQVLSDARTSPYLPLVKIFIESGALSLISKIVQLVVPSVGITTNPLVIPLCVSKNKTCLVHQKLIYFRLLFRRSPLISSSSEKHSVLMHSTTRPLAKT